jgi:hypothetical protein
MHYLITRTLVVLSNVDILAESEEQAVRLARLGADQKGDWLKWQVLEEQVEYSCDPY